MTNMKLSLAAKLAKYVVAPVIVGVLISWVTGVFDHFLPPPQRVYLAISNTLTHPSTSPTRFRFVLCWLKNDDGTGAEIVKEAFYSIEGVDLVQSATIVEGRGAADNWRPEMRTSAKNVMNKWDADLAIVGVVKNTSNNATALSLWFIPRVGDDNLDRAIADHYRLEHASLQPPFSEDVYKQVGAYALIAASEGTYDEILKGVLQVELSSMVKKLRTLVNRDLIVRPSQKADLRIALASSLQVLGDLEGGTKRLGSSIKQFQAALVDLGHDAEPRKVIKAQNGLGIALMTLGEKQENPGLVHSAVKVFRDLAEAHSFDSTPEDWAIAHNNLGNALALSGKLQKNPLLLKDAIISYQLALRVRTREEAPRAYARTQINIGIALALLGLKFQDQTALKSATELFLDALDLLSFERSPADWAKAQMNLGNTLQIMGEVKEDIGLLNDAVSAFRKALKVYTRASAPLKWAHANYNAAQSLVRLGRLRKSTDDFREAIVAYKNALKEYPMDREEFRWAETQSSLAVAYALLADEAKEPAYFNDAIIGFLAGLKVYQCDVTPSHCSKSYRNLEALVLSLVELDDGASHIERSISVFRNSLNDFCRNGERRKWEMTQKVLRILLMHSIEEGRNLTSFGESGLESLQSWSALRFSGCAGN